MNPESQPQPDQGIVASLDRLKEAMSGAMDQLDQLASRLNPLMTKSEAILAAPEQPIQESSDVRESIDRLSSRAEEIANVVRSLCERVDI